MKPGSTVEIQINSQSAERELTPPECNFQAYGFATATPEFAPKLSSEVGNNATVEACGDQAEVDVCSVQSTAETWDEKAPDMPPIEVHKGLPPSTVRGDLPGSPLSFEWPSWLEIYNMKTVLFCLLRPQLISTVFCGSIGA